MSGKDQADNVTIDHVYPQVEAPNTYSVDQQGNGTPGPAQVSYGVVGRVNGGEPVAAFVPAVTVDRTREQGYHGPGLHQILAGAIHQAASRFHHTTPVEHFAGMQVQIGPDVANEPTPTPDNTPGQQQGQPATEQAAEQQAQQGQQAGGQSSTTMQPGSGPLSSRAVAG